MKADRRTALAGLAGGLALLTRPGRILAATPPSFVARDGAQLVRGGEPYRIVGANMWYAAWLGADAPYGDRARLGRELDRLKALGVNNLRIMASAEEGPLRNSIKPGFSRADGSRNETLYAGLDFALAEIGKRGMTAIVCLGNFWEWSGGFETWLYRVTGRYMDMNDPAHPWPAYPDATAAFYANPEAVALYHDHVRSVVTRTNSINGQRYVDDRAIMGMSRFLGECQPPVVFERMLRLAGSLRQRQAVERLPVNERSIAPPPSLALLDTQEVTHIGEPFGIDVGLQCRPSLRHSVDCRYSAVIAVDQFIPQRPAGLGAEGPRHVVEPQQVVLIDRPRIAPLGRNRGSVLLQRVATGLGAIEPDPLGVGAVVIAGVPLGPGEIADPRSRAVMVPCSHLVGEAERRHVVHSRLPA